jgi:hypothetical protein
MLSDSQNIMILSIMTFSKTTLSTTINEMQH